MQQIHHPPAQSENRTLTTQHVDQLGVGNYRPSPNLSGTLFRSLPTSRTSFLQSNEDPISLSSWLNNPFFPKVVSSLSYRRWMFILLHTVLGKCDVIYRRYPYSTVLLAIAQGSSLNVLYSYLKGVPLGCSQAAVHLILVKLQKCLQC